MRMGNSAGCGSELDGVVCRDSDCDGDGIGNGMGDADLSCDEEWCGTVPGAADCLGCRCASMPYRLGEGLCV